MNNTFYRLWDDFFAEECALIDTDEERALIRRANEIRKNLDVLLTPEQNKKAQEYAESIYAIQNVFLKKAFFKGCKFAFSFFIEAVGFGDL